MPNSHLRDGKKATWEELRWDQDIGRWVGPGRDELPNTLHDARQAAEHPHENPSKWHLGDH
jgi:hypothetical protein